MDPTRAFDPNTTLLSGNDPLRTQMMPAATTPSGEPGLGVEVVPGRTASMANGPAREQFLLELKGSGAQAGGRTALNLCLAIDRSGSMEGAPLEYVKQACAYVVDLLSPADVLSILTFEETVQVLLPPQRVGDKGAIHQAIRSLEVGNTTNLSDALGMGCSLLSQPQEGARATRLMLLSDGDPTAGIKDFASLVNLAGEVRKQGITCTFLGFGPDYNEELIAGMAKRSGGSYYYIPNPELIPEVFRTELDKLMTVVARNVRLQLKLARWVTLRDTQGQTSSPGEREFSFDLADVERGSTLQRVLDFEFPNHPLGWYRVAEGTLTYDDLAMGKEMAVPVDFALEFTADAARYTQPQDPRVAQSVQIDLASRAVERTLFGLKTQQLTAAGAIENLEKTRALLLDQGRVGEAQEVTMALRAIQTGNTGQAEKTLIGTMLHLDQGKQ